MSKLLENNISTIDYSEYLREDFILCSIKIKYKKRLFDIIEAYINHYEYGIIEIKDGKKEIHVWETEDQSQSSSYLSRRYTVTLLNGVNTNKDFENKFIETVIKFIIHSSMDSKIKNILNKLIKRIKKIH
jgi:hypothetical protein